MQSEFTSHIGLNSNLFCRVCMTCKLLRDTNGSDKEEAANEVANGSQKKRRRTKKKKTKEELIVDNIDRACHFMMVGILFLSIIGL